MGEKMKKMLVVFFLVLAAALGACTPQATAQPTATAVPPTATTVPVETAAAAPTSTAAAPAEATAAPTAAGDGPSTETWLTFDNAAYGLSFQYPANWFGPEVYAVDTTLRVEVGSDVVYPYGTGLDERTYNLNDSYYVTIQYTKNNMNTFWEETFQTLTGMQDGATTAGAREMLIRVRPVTLGRFHGFEYISTLSESAQTEPVYSRNVMLIDDQSNLLTVMGNPNNVQVDPSVGWRAAYQAVDEANREIFQKIVDSITIQ
jgi:hypothetical protein